MLPDTIARLDDVYNVCARLLTITLPPDTVTLLVCCTVICESSDTAKLPPEIDTVDKSVLVNRDVPVIEMPPCVITTSDVLESNDELLKNNDPPLTSTRDWLFSDMAPLAMLMLPVCTSSCDRVNDTIDVDENEKFPPLMMYCESLNRIDA
jgi:hypothetical protein